MARARNIKPGFFTNEELVELPMATRLLFIGLWTVADREGRLEDRPKRIKMAVFPADEVDVDAALDALQAAGFLLRYEIAGQRYIEVLAFNKHQNPHRDEKASTLPAPCRQRAGTVSAAAGQGGDRAESLSSDSGLPESGIPDTGPPAAGSPAAGLPDGGLPDRGRADSRSTKSAAPDSIDLESATSDSTTPEPLVHESKSRRSESQAAPHQESAFGDSASAESHHPEAKPQDFGWAWQHYPPRPGANKAAAQKAWNARVKAGIDPAVMLAGLRRYAAFVAATRTEPQYVKQPANFFGPDAHYESDWTIPQPSRAGPPESDKDRRRRETNEALTGRTHHEPHRNEHHAQYLADRRIIDLN
jgi:hypothetical protein